MKIYIKQATIVDPTSRFHKAQKDILIENGTITKIEDAISIKDADQTISSDNLHVSLSWVDLKANFCDPGNEHKEDLQTGLAAAVAGGFGHVYVSADNIPTTDNKAQVKYIKNASADAVTKLHPIGAISEGMKSEQLAEMYDMYQNGVRLYSDSNKFLSAGIMHRALLYAQNFDGLVVSFPQNASIVGEGQVNEGIASVKTGMKPIPDVGETIQIQRDISLLEYTGGRLHFSGISLARSVALIKEAKERGLKVSCDVNVNQLLYTENDVLTFDTNFKVLPPYRTENDQKALWEGLRDGTIDCIVSDHQPQNLEEKEVEFDNASFGNITIQSVYGSLSNHFSTDHDLIIEKLSNAPRVLTGMEVHSIEKGAVPDITLFDPSREWEFTPSTNRSKSQNSPLLNTTIQGAVIGVIRGGKSKLNQSI